ncbi:MAG TPA: hypothetical protein DGA22_08695 [Acidobacterium sp.]|nr:hypothetical protein [Acidobacterium sp.]
MPKWKCSVEQIVGVPKQAEVGVPIAELIRKVGFAIQWFLRRSSCPVSFLFTGIVQAGTRR